MSNFLDIQNILQTGYYNTSRARNAFSSFAEPQSHPSTISSAMHRYASPFSLGKKPHRRRSYPPPPSVEDEVVSLAREHEGSVAPVLEEEPQSRGEIEQQPIMLQVHEHNPERRFLIVSDSSQVSGSGAEENASRKEAHRRTRSGQQPSLGTRNGRKDDRSESTGRMASDDNIPNSERRRSRQDLPRLETDVEEIRPPAHHRSKSAASATRPDLSPPRQYRPYGQAFLSPEVTKHGATVREKSHYGYGRVSTDGAPSPTHSSPGTTSYRRWEDKQRASPFMEGRPSSAFETSSSRRPISNDRINDPRRRDENRSPQIDTRDNFEPYRSGAGGRLPYRSREHSCSCSGDEGFQSSRRRGNSIVIDDERESIGHSRKVSSGTRYARSPSRTGTAPANSTEFPDERIPTPRSSTAFHIDNEGRSQERRKPQLPYPDDDDMHGAWPGQPGSGDFAGHSPSGSISIASMPHIPPVVDGLVVHDDTGARVRSPSAAPSPKAWQPPSFDPNRDGIRTDNSVGSYRRYSENRGSNGPQERPEIPECMHTEPVAGKMNWLTLHKTDFNICSDCYDRCFYYTDYRNHFQPMLRPTVSPIACDFGTSPWYRIAWLLILKHKVPDLQLLYDVANIMSASRSQPCPSDRKAVRDWYTIVDPYTRRPVPEFTVCYQCAIAIEALLPSLANVFLRLDSRHEPTTSSVCALHFSPDREQFVLFFDAFETTSDKAYATNRQPDIGDLSMTLRRVITLNECRKDRRVSDGYWYTMDFLPEFSVCGECYEAVVRPQRAEDSVVAQDFYSKPRQLPTATCQLYSRRMRDIFERACRRNDPAYLQDKVRERLQMEDMIHNKFLNLIKNGRDAWTDEQIIKLSRDWKKWE